VKGTPDSYEEQLISNRDLFQPHLKYTLTFCNACTRTSRSRSFITNLIHPLARDVKDTLLTRIRQLTADSDSNSLLGVLLLGHVRILMIIGYYTLLYI
jgi:hypothetical protein